jgi:hypothetical protein
MCSVGIFGGIARFLNQWYGMGFGGHGVLLDGLNGMQAVALSGNLPTNG